MTGQIDSKPHTEDLPVEETCTFLSTGIIMSMFTANVYTISNIVKMYAAHEKVRTE